MPTLIDRQAAMKVSAAGRKVRRSALLAEKRKAKVAKLAYRKNQDNYLKRKKAKVALIRGEREAYQQSTREFMLLCEELRNTKDRLRGARLAYEDSLTRQQREALQYASGFAAGREMEQRAQVEVQQHRIPKEK
jgi:hypothetical protein